MKPILKISIAVSILFFANLVTAQTFKTSDAPIAIAGFSTQTSQENFLLNQSIAATVATNPNSNSVYVSQIGNNNDLVSTTKSTESTIVVIQKGNENSTVLDINSAKLSEMVVQNGDNNTVLDYGLFKSDVRNATINQTGDNQNLTMFGSNSLSEKMKVSMQGQDQSIIIRNF